MKYEDYYNTENDGGLIFHYYLKKTCWTPLGMSSMTELG